MLKAKEKVIEVIACSRNGKKTFSPPYVKSRPLTERNCPALQFASVLHFFTLSVLTFARNALTTERNYPSLKIVFSLLPATGYISFIFL